MPATKIESVEIRTFEGEHGELDEAVAGLLASLQGGLLASELVEAVYSVWVENVGWRLCVVMPRKKNQ
jgi:hypothetical protein